MNIICKSVGVFLFSVLMSCNDNPTRTVDENGIVEDNVDSGEQDKPISFFYSSIHGDEKALKVEVVVYCLPVLPVGEFYDRISSVNSLKVKNLVLELDARIKPIEKIKKEIPNAGKFSILVIEGNSGELVDVGFNLTLHSTQFKLGCFMKWNEWKVYEYSKPDDTKQVYVLAMKVTR